MKEVPVDLWAKDVFAALDGTLREVRLPLFFNLLDGPPRMRERPADPGDRLWVREHWAATSLGGKMAIQYLNANTNDEAFAFPDIPDELVAGWLESNGHQWRAPQSMPRWASRILLEATSVDLDDSALVIGMWLWVIGVRRIEQGAA